MSKEDKTVAPVKLRKDSIEIGQPFSDYYRVSVPDFMEDLDGIKKTVQDELAKRPELIDTEIKVSIKNGYYDDKHIVFHLVGQRPYTDEEKEQEKKNEERRLQWQRAEYEKLKKQFEGNEKAK
jgi:hypothetical protein